jgi:hypothetical protein
LSPEITSRPGTSITIVRNVDAHHLLMPGMTALKLSERLELARERAA